MKVKGNMTKDQFGFLHPVFLQETISKKDFPYTPTLSFTYFLYGDIIFVAPTTRCTIGKNITCIILMKGGNKIENTQQLSHRWY